MLSDTPWLALFLSLIGHSKQLKQLCTYLIGWGLYSCLSWLGGCSQIWNKIRFGLVLDNFAWGMLHNVNGKKKIRSSPLKDWSGRRLRALHSLILLRRLDTSERTLDLVISKLLLEVLNSKTLKIEIVTSSQPAALSSSPLDWVNLKEWDTSSPPLPLVTSLLVN